MATVTGLVASRMLEIEGEIVVGGIIDEAGHLILEKQSGETVDAGLVRGSDGIDGIDGIDGVDGTDGEDGTDGTNGVGLPTGGDTGQVPVKNSAVNYDIGWQDFPSSLPEGGTTGQVAAKASNADNDVEWIDPPEGALQDIRWILMLDDPLDDEVGWTESGTSWSVVGGVLNQNVLAAAYQTFQLDQLMELHATMVEVEIRMLSGTTNTGRAGISFALSGLPQVTLQTRVAGNVSHLDFELSTVTNHGQLALPANIAFNTWIKLKLIKIGSSISVYVNNVFMTTYETSTSAQAIAPKLTLRTYAATADFRNFKVWKMSVQNDPVPTLGTVLLEAGQGASSVPVGTPANAIIFRKKAV